MTRREAVLAIISTTVGVMSGRAKFVSAESNQLVVERPSLWDEYNKPHNITWDLGQTEEIILILGERRVSVLAEEIMDALEDKP